MAITAQLYGSDLVFHPYLLLLYFHSSLHNITPVICRRFLLYLILADEVLISSLYTFSCSIQLNNEISLQHIMYNNNYIDNSSTPLL